MLGMCDDDSLHALTFANKLEFARREEHREQ
jgi:hypothetical protein